MSPSKQLAKGKERGRRDREHPVPTDFQDRSQPLMLTVSHDQNPSSEEHHTRHPINQNAQIIDIPGKREKKVNFLLPRELTVSSVLGLNNHSH